MGLATSKLYERVADLLSFTTKTRVLLLGLDAAGKTTLLYKLKLKICYTILLSNTALKKCAFTLS